MRFLRGAFNFTILENEMNKKDFEERKREQQLLFLEIQKNAIKRKERLVIVFEGKDTAGKTSAVKNISEKLIAKHTGIYAFGIPTKSESKHWFKRYKKSLNENKTISFFDRSWYTRGMLEPVMGYCTKNQYKDFMKTVNGWESKQKARIVKIYLNISYEEQTKRFKDRIIDPLSFHKFSENDLNARSKWDLLSEYEIECFKKTNDWTIITTDSKRRAIIDAMIKINIEFSDLIPEFYSIESIKQEQEKALEGLSNG